MPGVRWEGPECVTGFPMARIVRSIHGWGLIPVRLGARARLEPEEGQVLGGQLQIPPQALASRRAFVPPSYPIRRLALSLVTTRPAPRAKSLVSSLWPGLNAKALPHVGVLGEQPEQISAGAPSFL